MCILVSTAVLAPVPNTVTLFKAWLQQVLVASYAEYDWFV